MRRELLLAAFAGMCLGRCHLEWQWMLGWIALGPLGLAVSGKGPLRGLLLGAVAGLSGGLYLYGVVAYGPRALVGLLTYCALNVGLVGAAMAFFAGAPALLRSIVPALAWTFVEWLRAQGSFSFPFTLGGSQAELGAFVQLASLGGEGLLSFFVAWGGGVLWVLTEEGKGARRAAGVFAGALLLGLAYGWLRVPAELPAGPRVSGLQSGAPSWLYERALGDQAWDEKLSGRYRQLVAEARGAGAELVVAPEHAVWGGVAERPELVDALTSGGLPVLFGADRRDDGGALRNSVFMAKPGEAPALFADKVQLAPVVEAAYTAGGGFSARDALGRVGVLICLESLYGRHARTLARDGAEWLLVLTNDAGFRRSHIGPIHAERAIVRAVETGRPLLRVAQAGVSLAVDSFGRVQARRGLFEIGEVGLTLSPPRPTLYLVLGDAVGWGSGLGLLAAWLWSRRRNSARDSENAPTKVTTPVRS